MYMMPIELERATQTTLDVLQAVHATMQLSHTQGTRGAQNARIGGAVRAAQ